MNPKPDDRSALAVGLDWGTRITTIGLEFGVPACLGYGLDRWWNTVPWMTVAGLVLGMIIGVMHMIRLIASLQRADSIHRKSRLSSQRGQSSPEISDVADRREAP